jgi:peptide/nickel transport system substrate-binding protein
MMLAPTYEEAEQWAWNGLKILMQDMPIITCYNSISTHAYRTDRWTGYVKMPTMGVMGYNPWTYTSVRLRETAGGPFGCYPTTYRCSFEGDVVTSNVLRSGKAYEQIVFGMICDSLWELDPITWEPSPLIARNWTIEETSASGDIQDGQKFTFQLFDNITWHDGAPLTSADVAYSLETLWPNSTVSSRQVENIYRIETPGDFTVIIYSNVSGIFEFTEATSLFILPQHIWEP